MPTNSHVRKSISQELKKTLETIGIGNGWHTTTTPTVERMKRSISNVPNTPIIIISLMGEDKARTAQKGFFGVYQATIEFEIEYIIDIEDETTWDDITTDMVHDIELAVGKNPTLSGTAIDTEFTGNETLASTDNTPRIGVLVTMVAKYRYGEDDPSQPI